LDGKTRTGLEGLTARSHGVMVSLSKVCEAPSCTTAGGTEEDAACALDRVRKHRNNASKQEEKEREVI
jgi:hypothetical protein